MKIKFMKMKNILIFFNPKHTGRYPYIITPAVTRALYLPLVIFSLSFIWGTLLLLLFAITKSKDLYWPGYIYVLSAISFNLMILASMLLFALVYNRYFWLILQKTCILLVNIPIAWFYLYLFRIMKH
jgi:hypothetical protein